MPNRAQAGDIGPLLHGLVEVREWMSARIPGARSAVGLDTFLRIAHHVAAGEPVDSDALIGELPYSAAQVQAQLRRLRDTGLLAARPGSPRALQATPQLLALLHACRAKLGGQFIAREPLREEQLFVGTREAALADLARLLYDRFFDLGWLYLHRFGGVCFLAASLVCAAAQRHGHRARVESGYVEVKSPQRTYLMGAEGFAVPGRIDGHAMCIVDDAAVIDFGLGTLRCNYRRDFYWGLAADYAPAGAVSAEVQLGRGEVLRWKNDWHYPGSEAEFAGYRDLVTRLMAEYAERYGND